MKNKYNLFLELYNYIDNYQKNNDITFSSLPIDNHCKLIFNFKNQILEFIFSNSILRDDCLLNIPEEYMSQMFIRKDDETKVICYLLEN